MSNLHWVAIVALLCAGAAPAAGQRSAAAERVAGGMTCSEHERASGPRVDCTYRVGRDLQFTVAGVGEKDVAVYFERSAGYEGDYLASFALEYRCVVVRPGQRRPQRAGEAAPAELAFVSPSTGKVFSEGAACAADSGVRSP